ncbi:MAG: Ig domain-containing protein [Bacteroidaceae bacterium]|nr:Ig domain-containing protein [Bacteroidaceae bacterium]
MTKNHSFRHTLFLVWMSACSLLAASCGLLDMEFDEGTQMVYEMRLDRDTVTVMVGDTFVLAPVFVPDSVSNHEVFFVSGADSVATVKDGAIIATGEGETVITAISVSGAKRADCQVYVMAPWTVNPFDYSDDMIVYTTATIDGQPFDPETQQIGAFSGPEFRGMGQLVEWEGRKFLQFRIYGHYEWGDDEPTMPELIRFACYDRKKVTFEYLPLAISFDGETHGSPSEPLEL